MRTAILTLVLLLAFALPLQAQACKRYGFLAHGGAGCGGPTAMSFQSG